MNDQSPIEGDVLKEDEHGQAVATPLVPVGVLPSTIPISPIIDRPFFLRKHCRYS